MEEKKITLPHCGKKITVISSSHGLSVLRAGLVLEAEADWEMKHKNEPRSIQLNLQRYDYTYLYPSLIACSKGKTLPTYEEFANLIEADANLWIDTVKKVNAHWFPREEEEPDATPADLAKKDEPPTNST
jgi:hypothetical protein